MNVGMDDGFVNMLVLVLLCFISIQMYMLMMFVMGMRMAMGEHLVLMKMAVHLAVEEEYPRNHA